MTGVQYLSCFLAKLERRLAGALCFILFILICTNILVRELRIPIYWIDEAAIYVMIWMGFLAAASALENASHVCVTLFSSRFDPSIQFLLYRITNGVMVIFGFCLCWLSWRWFDPWQLVKYGGDIPTFSKATLNFIYTEPTTTIGIRKFWFWLIMPWFSISLTVHSLAKLFDTPRSMYQHQQEAT